MNVASGRGRVGGSRMKGTARRCEIGRKIICAQVRIDGGKRTICACIWAPRATPWLFRSISSDNKIVLLSTTCLTDPRRSNQPCGIWDDYDTLRFYNDVDTETIFYPNFPTYCIFFLVFSPKSSVTYYGVEFASSVKHSRLLKTILNYNNVLVRKLIGFFFLIIFYRSSLATYVIKYHVHANID